jgi:hypothetical protein
MIYPAADVAQLVEHHLAKVRVAVSNTVVRSTETPGKPGASSRFAIMCGRWLARVADRSSQSIATRSPALLAAQLYSQPSSSR